MNGMEKITARMKEDAARSLSELNAQTEQELRRIREESAARAEKERETAGGRAHLAAQERYERLCSAAEMETRKLTLSAKQKVLAETYDRALEILRMFKAQKGNIDPRILDADNGAAQMARLFIEDCTDLTMYIGRAINPAHQNPNLPMDLSIKLRLLNERADAMRSA